MRARESVLNNTNKLNRALEAIREQLIIEALTGIEHANITHTAVASSCAPSNHVFTSQLPDPIVLFFPHKLF